MHSREFRAPCKSGDNAELSVTFTTYDDDDGGADDYISFKTSRGKSVWIKMKDARELAGWLIEHAIDVEPMLGLSDDLQTYSGASGSVGYKCVRADCKAYMMQVEPQHLHLSA